MNKTITINISGIIFHIDEYAYEILSEYLNNLKRHFANTEGGDEIINDIESRIAEIFQTKLSDRKQVIILDEVNEVINILGKPESFDNSESNGKGCSSNNRSNDSFKSKRLFRDNDNKVLGGVCSGLGYYFGIDPVWLRLAFVLALIFFGSGILVYLVLWIVIPRAVTTEEKLDMKGEKVNISEIEKNIKEELEELKRRFNNFKKNAKNNSKEEFDSFKKKMDDVKNDAKGFRYRDHTHSAVHNTVSAFVTIVQYIVKAILIFVGIILLIVALALIFALVMSLTGSTHNIFLVHGNIHSVSIPAIGNLIFEQSHFTTLTIIGLALMIGVPLLMMIFGGIRLIFGIRRRIRLISFSGILLFLSGLVLCAYVAFNISQQFIESSNYKVDVTLKQPKDSVLYLSLSDKSLSFDKNTCKDECVNFDDCVITNDDDLQLRFSNPKLKIIKSNTNQYELQIIKTSSGTSDMRARNIASKISYNFTQKDSLLMIDNFFTLGEKSKWRNQKVRIILKVPVGKTIKINDNLEDMICNEDNSDDVLCSSSFNSKFLMTDNGFAILK